MFAEALSVKISAFSPPGPANGANFKLRELRAYGTPSYSMYHNSLGDVDGGDRDSQAYNLVSHTHYDLRIKPINGLSKDFKDVEDYALQFDGVEGAFDIRDTLPAFGGGGEFTIEAWVNIEQAEATKESEPTQS